MRWQPEASLAPATTAGQEPQEPSLVKLAALPATVDAVPLQHSVRVAAGVACAPPHLLAPGDAVLHYTIVAVLGRGGMGDVYLAHDDRLQRKVALKMLRRARHGTERQLVRLRREARALAQLHHPQVVQIFEVGEANRQTFLAMEYVEGETLRSYVESQRRSVREIVDVFAQAAEGLLAAHRAGMVHRDFKPDNVLVGRDGRVRVLDFGLAVADAPASARTNPPLSSGTIVESGPSEDRISPSAAIDDEQRLTQVGALVGTLPYMAPEQLLALDVGAKADQFSFFASLFECIYGDLPWELDAIDHEVHRGSIAARCKVGAVPRGLRRALARGLSQRPEDRFETMQDVLDALREPPITARTRASIVAAGVGAVLWGQMAAADCPPPESLWSSHDAGELLEKARSTDRKGFDRYHGRLQSALARYGEQWRDDHVLACRTGNEAARACLDETRRAFDAQILAMYRTQTVDALELGSALEAVLRLPELETCMQQENARVTAAPEVDPSLSDEARERMRERLESVRAQRRLGRMDVAQEEARALLADLSATKELELANATRFEVGVLEHFLGSHEAAARELERVYLDAQTSRSAELAIDAATALVRVHGYGALDLNTARRWAQHARASLLSHHDERRLGNLLANEGDLLYIEEKYADAARLYESAASLFRNSKAALDELRMTSSLATCVMYLGEAERAVELLEGVVEAQTRLLGVGHPSIDIGNLALAHWAHGNYARAEALLRQLIEVEGQMFGGNPERQLETLGHLGAVLMLRHEYGAAERVLQRALALAPPQPTGDVQAAVVKAQVNLGQTWINLGRLDEAESMLHRALQSATSDDARGARITAMQGLALAQSIRGRHAEANAWFQRTWDDINIGGLEDSLQSAHVLVSWAQSLHEDQRLDEARERIDDALARYERLLADDALPLINALLSRGQIIFAQEGIVSHADLDRAIELARAHRFPRLHAVVFNVAEIIGNSDLPRSRALATEALQWMQRLEHPDPAELRAVQQWLADHPLPRAKRLERPRNAVADGVRPSGAHRNRPVSDSRE